jgi:hypothetical protein
MRVISPKTPKISTRIISLVMLPSVNSEMITLTLKSYMEYLLETPTKKSIPHGFEPPTLLKMLKMVISTTSNWKTQRSVVGKQQTNERPFLNDAMYSRQIVGVGTPLASKQL